MENDITDVGKIAITPQKDYSESTNYEWLDVVTYDGASYMCVSEDGCTGIIPTNEEYWQLLADKGHFTKQDKEEFKQAVVEESKATINEHTETKKEELDNYTTKQETSLKNELDIYTTTKEKELDTHKTTLESEMINTKDDLVKEITDAQDDFDKNVTVQTTAFNENATKKTETFNNNVTEQTNTFNTNAKTKQTEFDNNATEKLEEYNDNSTTKINEFNENAESYATELEDLNGRVEVLENRTGHIYGVRQLLDSTSATLERIGDSVGLTANATKDGSIVTDDFAKLYPWCDINSFNIDIETLEIKAWYGDPDFKFDGSNGDVYTYFPKFWYKLYKDDKYKYYMIADYPAKGFIHAKSNSESRYKLGIGADGKLHSYSGMNTANRKSIKTYRNMIRELGDKFCLLDYRYFLYQLLFIVKYATFNSQEAIGQGMCFMRNNSGDKALIAEENTNRFIVNTTAGNAFIVGQQISIGKSKNEAFDIADTRTIIEINDYSDDNGITGKEIIFSGDSVDITTNNVIWSSPQDSGSCDKLGMKDGCLANDGKHGVLLMGIENPFSNIYDWIDGINIKDRVSYICYDYTQYESDKFDAPYYPLSYVNCASNCYPKQLGFDENNPLAQFPIETGGGSTSGTTDYYYQNTGNRVARVGGNLNDGAGCGLWFWNLYNDSSNAAWNCGARALINQ